MALRILPHLDIFCLGGEEDEFDEELDEELAEEIDEELDEELAEELEEELRTLGVEDEEVEEDKDVVLGVGGWRGCFL